MILTSIVHGISLGKDQCPDSQEERDLMKDIPYALAIGSIMYAMLCTRPDVAYALRVTSSYQSNPGIVHWEAVKRILKYLRRTKELFLVYGGSTQSKLVVTGYTDSNFENKEDFKSQSAYVFSLNGGAISWRSSKQSTIADSSTEAEYIAALDAAKEAVWMKKFIEDLGVVPSIANPIEIYCDNNGAIAQAKEPRSHKRSKHVLRKFHLIREIYKRGDIEVNKVDSEDNVADQLTKPHAQAKLEEHVGSMGLKYLSM